MYIGSQKSGSVSVSCTRNEIYITYIYSLAHFTDIGMPSDQTRDGTWSVNNWNEHGFLVFDGMFLDNRKNKRYLVVCIDMFVSC